jgi:hypothetical protein
MDLDWNGALLPNCEAFRVEAAETQPRNRAEKDVAFALLAGALVHLGPEEEPYTLASLENYPQMRDRLAAISELDTAGAAIILARTALLAHWVTWMNELGVSTERVDVRNIYGFEVLIFQHGQKITVPGVAALPRPRVDFPRWS